MFVCSQPLRCMLRWWEGDFFQINPYSAFSPQKKKTKKNNPSHSQHWKPGRREVSKDTLCLRRASRSAPLRNSLSASVCRRSFMRFHTDMAPPCRSLWLLRQEGGSRGGWRAGVAVRTSGEMFVCLCLLHLFDAGRRGGKAQRQSLPITSCDSGASSGLCVVSDHRRDKIYLLYSEDAT